MDKLQDKIRKLKSPIAVDFSLLPEHIPPHILDEYGSFLYAYKSFCKDVLAGLTNIVPAVRFSMPMLALYGAEGLDVLQELLFFAHKQGFYILLDVAEYLNGQNLTGAVNALFAENSYWYFDGLVTTAYTGSDAIRPYISAVNKGDKDIFIVARTSNKSAAEIQDLLSGSRHTHLAMAEVANRFAQTSVGRSGYSQIALIAAGSSPESLRSLRMKFKNLFLLVDGCDYPNANAKNSSYAFDSLGHGALACVSLYVTAAWMDDPEPRDFISCAASAAERLKKNFSRYVTIL